MSKSITERVATLTPEQRELLELLRKKRETNVTNARSLPAHAPEASQMAMPPASRVMEERTEKPVVRKKLSFSLFFFSDDGATKAGNKYKLLLDCARFADQNGFAAIWTPERHFMPFGGLYPNPSVIAAALAQVTERVQLRAGSVVLPLQNPIRVAEEWSVVDNLSNGRIAVAFASGWHPDDFVLAPDRYENRRERMFEEIETVKKLWKGHPLKLRNGTGKDIEVRIYPNPIQDELPIWITATSRETFVRAGEIGANVLTGLMEQDIEQCAENIGLYRESLKRHGYAPHQGQVTVMLHTFLGEEIETVKEKARPPFCNYLQSFIQMIEKNYLNNPDAQVDVKKVTSSDRDALLNYAFERYFKTGALLGTSQTCLALIDKLKAIDVDEIASLLDFGLDAESILNGLNHLKALKDNCHDEGSA